MATPPPPTNASSFSAPDGLAIVCAHDGTVQRIARAMVEGAEIRETLYESVDPSSIEACRLFLRAAARGFARSTPLRIGNRDLQCFGIASGGTILVAGVIDPGTAAAFAESVDGFESLAAEIRRTHSTYQLYEELALANNELVTAQRELARTVAELRRLNDYKDELLGMAAHDLRNPLNANAAYIAFLLRDSESFGEDARTLLARLRANSEYMLHLVENVLDFAAIQSGRVRLMLEDTAIDDLAAGVVDINRILAEANEVRIAYVVEDPMPRLQIDPVKITQALQNVVANAVQHSPRGAAVDVRLRRCTGGVEVEVQDRGLGIPPEELPLLFKPFTRISTASRAKHRSVGLGLAITRRLIEAHGGTIDVHSEVGQGSVFTMRLKA